MKKAVIVAALFIIMPCRAFALPFDAIVPSAAQIDTSGGGILTGSWGWVVATTGTIFPSDLTNATFTASISDPQVTISMQNFFNQGTLAPLSPLDVAGLSSTSNIPVYDNLLVGGETLVDPTIAFWFMGFQFPVDHTSNTTLTASVTIGSDVVNYTSMLTFGSSNPFFLVTQGQRISSTPVGPAPIPEPGTLLLIGSGLVGLGAGAWRRKKL